MKTATIAALALTALGVAVDVEAQQVASPSSAYIGGSLGQAKGNSFCDAGFGGGPGCDNRHTSWRVLGGYKFNPNFSLEGGYHDFGKWIVGGGGQDVKARAFELVGIGAVPLGNEFSLYGKLGLTRNRAKCDACIAGGGITSSNTATTWGFGGQFDFNRAIGMRLEFQRYGRVGGGGFPATTEVDVWSLGAIYRFK